MTALTPPFTHPAGYSREVSLWGRCLNTPGLEASVRAKTISAARLRTESESPDSARDPQSLASRSPGSAHVSQPVEKCPPRYPAPTSSTHFSTPPPPPQSEEVGTWDALPAFSARALPSPPLLPPTSQNSGAGRSIGPGRAQPGNRERAQGVARMLKGPQRPGCRPQLTSLRKTSPFPRVCFPSPARLCPALPSSFPAQTPVLSDAPRATLRGTLASSPAPPGEGC